MSATYLEQAIIRTIAYFDLFEYPLTATEVWEYLYRPRLSEAERSLMRIVEELESSAYLKERLTRVEGFYCFKGREALVPERKQRNNRTDRQMLKTIHIVRLLRFFPWVRMIAIISSLPVGNVRSESDIDLFIITKKNSIWLARLCVAGFLKVLRQRPDAEQKRDRFCLSFFITEDALDVSRAAFGPDDIAFHYYILSMMPIYDPDRVYPRFLEANQWLAKDIPNGYFERISSKQVSRPAWLKRLHRCIEIAALPFFSGPLSDWYCNMQLRILPERLKAMANVDSRVIISDQMLKFHDKDNRHQLLQHWHERVRRYA